MLSFIYSCFSGQLLNSFSCRELNALLHLFLLLWAILNSLSWLYCGCMNLNCWEHAFKPRLNSISASCLLWSSQRDGRGCVAEGAGRLMSPHLKIPIIAIIFEL